MSYTRSGVKQNSWWRKILFQVAHIAHLQQQAQHLQNLQMLQSHSLLSRLPQNLLPSGGAQSPAQGTVTTASLGQRSRLPPPGFPGSTPNHMNSFGLGIPRPAPTNSTLSGQCFSGVFWTSGITIGNAWKSPMNIRIRHYPSRPT